MSLSIYLADNHARTFDFLARNCSLDEPHALLLIDAHSDASRLGTADDIRDGLRQVISLAERRRRIDGWVDNGSVQAFNWIEPLMPRPIDHVCWVPGASLTSQEIDAFESEAREQLDANLDHRPRADGAFAARFRVTDLAHLGELDLGGIPVIASIDLDYFAGLAVDKLDASFQDVWEAVLAIPDLRYVTFAISRPWLTDDAEAHRLLELALRAVLTIDNANVQFEPFATEGPDRSENAKSLLREGMLPPRYDIETAPSTLRHLLRDSRSRLVVEHDTGRFDALLDQWRGGQPEFQVVLDGVQPSADGIVRVSTDLQTPLRVVAPPGIAIERVRWLASEPEHAVYNVLPGLLSGKEFTGDAATGFVRRKERLIAEIEGDDQWAAPVWKALADDETGWGEIQLRAMVAWMDAASGRGETPAPPVILRLSPAGIGEFRTALAEQFNRPYVFGAGFFARGDLTGPEAGDGNDCANFLIAAMRRTGRPVSWGNPAQLRPWLKVWSQGIRPADLAAIPDGALEAGYIVHFGNHATALWQDRPPLGKLDANDILAHHLGGKPELISFGDLYKRYDRPVDLYLVPDPSRDATLTVAIGGDMIFGDSPPELPDALRHALRSADLAVANLEGCPVTAAHQESWNQTRSGFTFTPSADRVLETVDALGLDIVSLANNHALDAGQDELAAGMLALQASGLSVAGVGRDAGSAITPVVRNRGGLRVGFIAVSLVPTEADQEAQKVIVATLPAHSEQIADQLSGASKELDTVIVLAHWGDEYTAEVNDEQRHWARWLVDHGASAVVGSHSHFPQEKDTWNGHPIWYSLGNLFAPNDGPNEGFRRQQVLQLAIDARGRILGGACVE
ncbi:MAG: CapA family protein [Verrucomicrobiales bacterium]